MPVDPAFEARVRELLKTEGRDLTPEDLKQGRQDGD
jgi:hypothetical protein